MRGGQTFPFTNEELDWLREHYQDDTYNNLALVMFERFGIKRSGGALKTVCREKLGLRKRPCAEDWKYSDEQKQWMRDHYMDNTYKVLAEEFTKTFDRPVSEKNFKRACQKLGLNKCPNHQYTPEEDAWIIEQSKLRTCELMVDDFNAKFQANCTAETLRARVYRLGGLMGRERAKKEGFRSYNEQPLGTEVFRNGYVWVKVKNLKGTSKEVRAINWRQKHIVVWESVHGPMPSDCKIIHADGDTRNNDISNLRLLTRSELAHIAPAGWVGKCTAITDAAIQYAKLACLLNDKK